MFDLIVKVKGFIKTANYLAPVIVLYGMAGKLN